MPCRKYALYTCPLTKDIRWTGYLIYGWMSELVFPILNDWWRVGGEFRNISPSSLYLCQNVASWGAIRHRCQMECEPDIVTYLWKQAPEKVCRCC